MVDVRRLLRVIGTDNPCGDASAGPVHVEVITEALHVKTPEFSGLAREIAVLTMQMDLCLCHKQH
jgi:hypothetical protein